MKTVKITIKSRISGHDLDPVAIPVFCIDHMRKTSREENLKTMRKYLEGNNVYLEREGEEPLDGIDASQVEAGLTLYVD